MVGATFWCMDMKESVTETEFVSTNISNQEDGIDITQLSLSDISLLIYSYSHLIVSAYPEQSEQGKDSHPISTNS